MHFECHYIWFMIFCGIYSPHMREKKTCAERVVRYCWFTLTSLLSNALLHTLRNQADADGCCCCCWTFAAGILIQYWKRIASVLVRRMPSTIPASPVCCESANSLRFSRFSIEANHRFSTMSPVSDASRRPGIQGFHGRWGYRCEHLWTYLSLPLREPFRSIGLLTLVKSARSVLSTRLMGVMKRSSSKMIWEATRTQREANGAPVGVANVTLR